MSETLVLTPSATVGPYLSIGLLREPIGSLLVPEDDPRAIRIRGRPVSYTHLTLPTTPYV